MSHHDRAMHLFDQAADMPRTERRAFLEANCADEPSMVEEVEALLAADDTAGAFLSDPAFNPADAAAKIVGGETVGSRISVYKLVEMIGEGGFGRVFLAEQERPVRRRVALKIIKLGMDTRQVIARFEAERQALAIMDHPGIAKVFDAGATSTGRPYFVMELVRGIPITKYCDEHRLSVRERLRLFVSVCQAIQHAHHKGVIHRDLKPSNVLVTMIDGQPVPKIIDFGIAKATAAGALTDRTIYTEYHQFIGTPAYMSPEQASMSGDDVDTRSDIYSLGVLLYELLTGTTPFDPRSIQNATYADVQKMIQSVEPPKPSTRIYSVRETLKQAAELRGGESRQLRRLFRGELDWIVMKCLEKQRSRRYDSASALAADLQAYLSNRAVAAAPPSRIYRARKFIATHRFIFGTAAALMIALGIGLVAAMLALQRLNFEQLQTKGALQEAERRRQEALEANESTVAINEFLNDMLASANPENARGGPLAVEDILRTASAGIGERFKDRPMVEVGVRQTLGLTFASLNQHKEAIEHLMAAMEIRRTLGVANNPEFLKVKATLAYSLHSDGKVAPARSLYLDVVKQAREELERDGKQLVPAVDVLAHSASYVDAPSDQMQALFDLATRRRNELLGPDHPDTLYCRMASGWYRALVKRPGDDMSDVSNELRSTLEGMRRVVGPADRRTLECQDRLARVLRSMGRREDAIAMARDAVDAAEKAYTFENPITLHAAANLSAMYRAMEMYEAVIPNEHRRLEALQKLYGENAAQCISPASILGDTYELLGRPDEALVWRRKRLEISRISSGTEAMVTLFAELQLGERLHRRGQIDEAVALFDHAIPLLRQQIPPGTRNLELLKDYAVVLQTAGRTDEALAAAREAYEGAMKMYVDATPPQKRAYAQVTSVLGLIYARRGEYSQAESHLRIAMEKMREQKVESGPAWLATIEHLEQACRAQGNSDEADKLSADLAKLRAATQPTTEARISTSPR